MSQSEEKLVKQILQLWKEHPDCADSFLEHPQFFSKGLSQEVILRLEAIAGLKDREDHPNACLFEVEKWLSFLDFSLEERRQFAALKMCWEIHPYLPNQIMQLHRMGRHPITALEEYAFRYILKDHSYALLDFSDEEAITDSCFSLVFGDYIRHSLGFENGIVPPEQKKAVACELRSYLQDPVAMKKASFLSLQYEDHLARRNGFERFENRYIKPLISNMDARDLPTFSKHLPKHR